VPLRRGQIAHGRTPLGVTGNENEPQVRDVAQQPAVHPEDNLLLPLVGAARHENGHAGRHPELGGFQGPELAADP